ncbi:MAG: glycosyltransferase family 2 protein [Verrucomicrobiales bacterium]|nr:glycosyltransferase family 2 protein [Verrucomicrobiales bacterium]
MSAVRISAVVPNYNHQKLVPRALEALLNQPDPPDEIIAIDDASTDESFAVMKEFETRSSRLRVIRNERNMGVCATLNRGLGMASHPYIGFFASDDEVLPGLFAKARPMVEQHPDAGLVTGLVEWRCHSTGMTWYDGHQMPQERRFWTPDDLVRLGRQGRLATPGQPAIYHKAALVKAGGWIPELRWFTDCFGTWVVGFRQGVGFIPEVMSVFNLYQTSFYNAAKAAERREVMARFLGLLESQPYADVLPRIRASGLLGGFGTPMLRLVAPYPRRWNMVNYGFARRMGRRTAEVVGRTLFPPWLARTCLRVFYGRKTRPGSTAAGGGS